MTGGNQTEGIKINLLDAFIIILMVYSVARFVSLVEQNKKEASSLKRKEDRKKRVDSLYGR